MTGAGSGVGDAGVETHGLLDLSLGLGKVGQVLLAGLRLLLMLELAKLLLMHLLGIRLGLSLVQTVDNCQTGDGKGCGTCRVCRSLLGDVKRA